ncbi:monocarboxylate transporter 6 isoform X3 [Chionomys nivalis]|uniref:monocarboxylate transporter 6 isoform X3 n=1 Tax=Chionomys nivalis TaxID=269649 RepID=UPI0025925D2A|nr:monocarboxylate transporter 6 isoform X3 [Chionomys nivalis]
MILGGMLSSLGMVVSSFSGSLSQLFLTAGLITGLLLDMTNNFKSIFYVSSFVLLSASLFIGGGFYAEEKKKKKKLKQNGQAKVEDVISESAPMQGLSSEDKDGARKQLCPESICYVTSV